MDLGVLIYVLAEYDVIIMVICFSFCSHPLSYCLFVSLDLKSNLHTVNIIYHELVLCMHLQYYFLHKLTSYGEFASTCTVLMQFGYL